MSDGLNQDGLRGNSSFGYNSFLSNSTGILNTAIGINTLRENTTGNQNTATGDGVLELNQQGGFNTASGTAAMALNLSGNGNTASGWDALSSNITGNLNTGFGAHTLLTNANGSKNTALGYRADVNVDKLSNATAIGANSRVDCDNCLVLGSVNGLNDATSNTQVGIGTTNPNASAALEISSTEKGILIPRMTQAERNAILSPATGLMIYQSDNTPGFYFHNGASWTSMTTNTNNLWSLNGNSGTNPTTNFIGTTDDQPLVFKVNNQPIGRLTLANLSLGFQSLNSQPTGIANTAIGTQALFRNLQGRDNTAVGFGALLSNISGSSNVAIGVAAMLNNLSGSSNIALGRDALATNNTGSANTAIGNGANTSADNLNNATAIGAGAIVSASNTVQIGNSNVTDVYFGNPTATIIHANSVSPSDARFKYNVKSNVLGLDFITKLNPVTYYFDDEKLIEFSKTGDLNNSLLRPIAYAGIKKLHSGFLAQDVEKLTTDLNYEFDGLHRPSSSKDHYSLSYTAFVVPLVKAVQEQQLQIEVLKKENEELKKLKEQVQKLTKIVESLSANK
jgi:trimeric autotransporter adhesin